MADLYFDTNAFIRDTCRRAEYADAGRVYQMALAKISSCIGSSNGRTPS